MTWKCINPRTVRSFLVSPMDTLKYADTLVNLSNDLPDGIILDLEDGVSSDRKDIARENIRKIFKSYIKLFDKYLVYIRINSYASTEYEKDIQLIKDVGINNIALTKVESKNELQLIKEHLKGCCLLVAIETLTGYINANSTIGILNKDDTLVLGYEDLCSELLIKRPSIYEQNTLSQIIMDCAISARQYSIPFYDSVFPNLTDMEEFKKECMYTRSLGLVGKLAIHPNQVSIINEIFDKTKDIEYAQNVINEYEKDSSKAIIRFNDTMVGPPEYKRCKNILKMYS